MFWTSNVKKVKHFPITQLRAISTVSVSTVLQSQKTRTEQNTGLYFLFPQNDKVKIKVKLSRIPRTTSAQSSVSKTTIARVQIKRINFLSSRLCISMIVNSSITRNGWQEEMTSHHLCTPTTKANFWRYRRYAKRNLGKGHRIRNISYRFICSKFKYSKAFLNCSWTIFWPKLEPNDINLATLFMMKIRKYPSWQWCLLDVLSFQKGEKCSRSKETRFSWARRFISRPSPLSQPRRKLFCYVLTKDSTRRCNNNSNQTFMTKIEPKSATWWRAISLSSSTSRKNEQDNFTKDWLRSSTSKTSKSAKPDRNQISFIFISRVRSWSRTTFTFDNITNGRCPTEGGRSGQFTTLTRIRTIWISTVSSGMNR